MMSTIKIFPKSGENVKVEILHLEEGEFTAGEWKAGRTLNGDEKYILRCSDNLSCFFLELFKY
jgi:hypothetical protein